MVFGERIEVQGHCSIAGCLLGPRESRNQARYMLNVLNDSLTAA